MRWSGGQSKRQAHVSGHSPHQASSSKLPPCHLTAKREIKTQLRLQGRTKSHPRLGACYLELLKIIYHRSFCQFIPTSFQFNFIHTFKSISMTFHHVMRIVPSRSGCCARAPLKTNIITLRTPSPITHGETSRARAVDARAIHERPLAHDHVVCLENNRAIK